MRIIRKLLSISLITMLLITLLPNINVQAKAAEEESYYKSFYYTNNKGKYVQNRYHYPEEAQKTGVPEGYFTQVGTYVYEGKLDEKSYIVNTYKDSDQGITPSETKTYLRSEYIVWINTSDTPRLSDIGSTSNNLLSSIKILSCDGLYIKEKDNSTPIVSLEMNKGNPDLITNGSRQIEAIEKGTIKSSDVGSAIVKAYDYFSDPTSIIKDAISTNWEEFNQFDKKLYSTSNTEIVAKKYNSQLEHVRAFGYFLSKNGRLNGKNQNITLCYDITYPADTPNSYKTKNRSLTTKYNFKVVGTNLEKTISKAYTINYSSTGDNKIDINTLNISVKAGEYYNGSAVKPKVTINHFRTEPKCDLIEGQDYKVTYLNNSTVGTGKVIIEGINYYKGKVTKEFSISLNKPNNLKSQSTSFTTANLAWDKVSGATGYEVYRSSNGGKSYVKIKAVTGNSYTDTGLTPGTKYQYKVRAYYTVSGKTQYSSYSSELSINTSSLGAPSNLTKQYSSYDSAQFAWSGAKGATGYEVYRSSNGGKSYTLIKTLTGNSYTDTGLNAGTNYKYKVRAYYKISGKNQYSSYSSELSISTNLKNLEAPTKLTKQYSSVDSIQFVWSGVSGATGYEVYRSIDGGKSYTRVEVTKGTSYKDIKLTPGKSYMYKVRAYKTVNGVNTYSSYSSIFTATTTSVSVGTPSNLKKESSSKISIKIAWNKVNGATGYEVYRSTNDGKNYSIVSNSSGSTFNNLGLTSKKTYKYKVRAYMTINGVKYYSSFSSVLTVKTN
ncbi:MAG: hypothetical protein GX275_05500 [Clostridiales bacterium]|nr:hypothetical protein [Clostridiales bacterium]